MARGSACHHRLCYVQRDESVLSNDLAGNPDYPISKRILQPDDISNSHTLSYNAFGHYIWLFARPYG